MSLRAACHISVLRPASTTCSNTHTYTHAERLCLSEAIGIHLPAYLPTIPYLTIPHKNLFCLSFCPACPASQPATMPSYNNERFQPLPPIRTLTSDSSGTASPEMLSPTSTYSRGARSPTSGSPAEDSFFGAISAKIRGRSRSRSRAAASRKRSTSPMLLPPQDMPQAPTRAPRPHPHPAGPTATASSAAYARRPQQPRHASSASQTSIASASGKPSPSRRSTSNSDMWRGRHSNSWLFNDFSFTETASKAFGRKSSS